MPSTDIRRILVTADPFLPVPPELYGGIERIIAALCGEYRSAGRSVALVALPGSTASVDALYPWRRGPGALGGAAAWAAQCATLSAAVRDFRPQVLHSFSRLAYIGRHLCSSLPKIMSYQRAPNPATTRYASRIARSSLVFTACSEHIARTGRRFGGEWRAIPNFVDLAKFDFKPAVGADAPLVFLSRLERIKGVHTAIAIAKAAKRSLIIAGNRVESPEAQAYWSEEIEPHIGADGISYVGPVNDEQKNALLGGAAAMVVPIEWEEPFGIVFAEALACGTPVISTRRGAAPEIVEHGRHGFLVDSIEDGAAAVARLGEISREACRSHVESRFALPVVAQEYLALYREVHTRRSGR